MTIRTVVAAAIAASAVSGCAPSMNAAVDTIRAAVQGTDRGVAAAVLNPNIRYLRVTLDGRLAFVALGSEDPHPLGSIQVWFSADGAVLRFQNGRVVGASGLKTEWRNVTLPELPPWGNLAQIESGLQWTRVRDVMPGYRFGVRDELLLQRIAAPSRSGLQGVDPQSLSWFEERLRSTGYFAAGELPPARYAVDPNEGAGTVVYGEQCLARHLCFTWQRLATRGQ